MRNSNEYFIIVSPLEYRKAYQEAKRGSYKKFELKGRGKLYFCGIRVYKNKSSKRVQEFYKKS